MLFFVCVSNEFGPISQTDLFGFLQQLEYHGINKLLKLEYDRVLKLECLASRLADLLGAKPICS